MDLSRISCINIFYMTCPRPCGRGGFKRQFVARHYACSPVPAHAGGVDLSSARMRAWKTSSVPAHAGGVDLSGLEDADTGSRNRPRPCGRGGFKLGLRPEAREVGQRPRPCGRGGFKQYQKDSNIISDSVPAHAGGVDLSLFVIVFFLSRIQSPPMRAGWI